MGIQIRKLVDGKYEYVLDETQKKKLVFQSVAEAYRYLCNQGISPEDMARDNVFFLPLISDVKESPRDFDLLYGSLQLAHEACRPEWTCYRFLQSFIRWMVKEKRINPYYLDCIDDDVILLYLEEYEDYLTHTSFIWKQRK